MKFRKWQLEALQILGNSWEKRPLIRAVMGAGKSIVIAEIVKRHQYSHDIVVSVPTRDLVEQLAETIETHTELMCGRYYSHAKTIATVTVVCNDSLANLPMPLRPFDPFARLRSTLWIADEAHQTECDTVKAFVSRWNPELRVGFSATPWRSSDRESISAFETLIYDYGAGDAIDDGVVVPPRIVHPEEGASVNYVCWEWMHSMSGPGVANAVGVEDAEEFAASLNMPVMCVHYKSPHNASDARKFLSLGGLRCVVYVDMLSEGFDCPAIDWMCLRRPVKSRVRFAQEVGRGLRARPGKTECLVFDPYDLFDSMGLSFEACLGEIDYEKDDVIPTIKLTQIFEETKTADSWNPGVEGMSAVRSYLRSTRVTVSIDGVIRNNGWRSKPASNKQMDLVASMFAGMSPERLGEHQQPLLACWMAMLSGELKKGDVSDLIAIVKNWRKL